MERHILFRVFKKADAFFDVLSKICAGICGALVIGVALMIFAGVINRTFIGWVWLFVEEWGSLALIPMSYLAFGYALRRGKHFKMDLVFKMFSPRVKSFLLIFAAVFSLFCLVYMIQFSYARLDHILVRGITSAGPMRTPLAPFAGAMLVGVCLFAADMFCFLVNKVIELKEKGGHDAA